MKITRLIAEGIADKVLKERSDTYSQKVSDLHEFIYGAVMEVLPDRVLETLNQFPSYFKKTNNIRLKYDDMETPTYMQNWTSKPVPFDYNDFVTIRKGDYWSIRNREDDLKREREQISKDRQEIMNSLVQLGTRKRVVEAFPELEQYFPSQITMALVPNMDRVRDILKGVSI